MSVQTLSQTGHTNAFLTLSRSLGAKDFRKSDAIIKFNEEPLAIDEVFVDAKSILDEENRNENNDFKDRIWVTAAVGIDYDKVPVTTKYTRWLNRNYSEIVTLLYVNFNCIFRGQNLVASFAMHEIRGKPDSCIFEWILCLDLKGYVPRYILDSVSTL